MSLISFDSSRELPWYKELLVGTLVGVVGIIALAITHGSWPAALKAFSMLLLVACAAFIAGVFVGFLFGIPRTNQAPPPQNTGAASQIWACPQYSTNTNLEQISDWLTKIIIGVGLVELTNIPPFLSKLCRVFGESIQPPIAKGIMVAVLVHFCICGFLLGYLWTRLHLTGELSRAERRAIGSAESMEGLINALLYQPAPGGFSMAIEYGQEYQKIFGVTNDRVWIYLACAYAQQYAFEKRSPKLDQPKLDQSRASALEAIDQAIQLSPKNKEFLRGLWQPDLATPGQDDLVVFADDPDFTKRLV